MKINSNRSIYKPQNSPSCSILHDAIQGVGISLCTGVIASIVLAFVVMIFASAANTS